LVDGLLALISWLPCHYGQSTKSSNELQFPNFFLQNMSSDEEQVLSVEAAPSVSAETQISLPSTNQTSVNLTHAQMTAPLAGAHLPFTATTKLGRAGREEITMSVVGFENERRAFSARTASNTKRKKRVGAGDVEDPDGWRGPWAGYEGEEGEVVAADEEEKMFTEKEIETIKKRRKQNLEQLPVRKRNQ
jgi:hypothetical protein